MREIVIVEDNAADAAVLQSYIREYAEKNQLAVQIKRFDNAIEFLEDYHSDADIVFMDIEMPLLNGMSAAKKLRQADDKVCIIFMTNVKKYALKGYEVDALDYVIKPTTYQGVAERLNRAFLKLERETTDFVLLTLSATEIIRVAVNDIFYVEKQSNFLIYHTVKGDYKMRGTLKDIMQTFQDKYFSLCISGFLVNLKYVEKVMHSSIIVNGAELPLARFRKESFKNDFLNYLTRR